MRYTGGRSWDIVPVTRTTSALPLLDGPSPAAAESRLPLFFHDRIWYTCSNAKEQVSQEPGYVAGRRQLTMQATGGLPHSDPASRNFFFLTQVPLQSVHQDLQRRNSAHA